MKKYLPLTGIIIITIILDLLSKYYAKILLENWNVDLFFWAKFMLAFNEWIAFSIPLTWILQIIISFVFLWVLIYYAKKEWNLVKIFPQISLWLIIWWALWNLYERVLFAKVTDFISVTKFFPTFNLADSFIFIWVCFAIFIELKNNNSKVQ